jgi:hypothetical protein
MFSDVGSEVLVRLVDMRGIVGQLFKLAKSPNIVGLGFLEFIVLSAKFQIFLDYQIIGEENVEYFNDLTGDSQACVGVWKHIALRY